MLGFFLVVGCVAAPKVEGTSRPVVEIPASWSWAPVEDGVARYADERGLDLRYSPRPLEDVAIPWRAAVIGQGWLPTSDTSSADWVSVSFAEPVPEGETEPVGPTVVLAITESGGEVRLTVRKK